MKLELFGDVPNCIPPGDTPEYVGKWCIGNHDKGGFLTRDGTVEPAREPFMRFYFDTLEDMELAFITAKIKGYIP